MNRLKANPRRMHLMSLMTVLKAWLLALTVGLAGCSNQENPLGNSEPPIAKNDSPKANTAAGDQVDPSNTSQSNSTRELTSVKLLLNWFPEAEHGGFYAAQVHGFFRDAGLDVEILPGGPNAPVVQQVAGKQVEFGVVNADLVVFGRAQQAPVVALLAPLQISPRCIIVHEKSGIKSFADMHDMTVAMSNTSAFSHYLRKKFSFKNVRIVPYPGNVTQFLQDQNFAQQGYVFSEPFVARKNGGDPKVLMVSDVGFNPYTSCLITNDETCMSNANLVQRMVECSVRGWDRYLKDPAETNEYIHSLNKEMSVEILEFGAKELRPLVLDSVAKKDGLGSMTESRWRELVEQLIDIGQLESGRVSVSELYTTKFLKQSKSSTSVPVN